MRASQSLLWYRLFVVMVIAAIAGMVICSRPVAEAAKVPPGGAPARGRGPIDLTTPIRVIDGNSFEAYINGNQVAVALLGIRAPQGNTTCGREATALLKSLLTSARRGGVRLVEDPTEVSDERGRQLYYVEERAGRPIADELVKAGVARSNGRGNNAKALAQQEDDARRQGRGCLWRGNAQPGRQPDTTPSPTPDGTPPVEATATSTASATAPSNSTPVNSTQPAASMVQSRLQAAAPDGFTDSVIASGLNQPTAFAFLTDGRVLVAQKSGLVRVVKDGAVLPSPLIDLTSHVNDYWDRGLLGIAADPNFAANGYVYLAYTYENDITEYDGPKTARITRVTVTGDMAAPASEVTIVGKQVGRSCHDFAAGADCIPSDFFSHTVGALKFAPDGSLLASIGESANFNVVDDDALRAQDLDSLAGKLIRVSATGDGLPSNPFWTGSATANRSKIWAYGLRNPYRFNVRPGTGTPFLGDVGWSTWEEIDVASKGANLGWPCYEGDARQGGYEPKTQCQALYATAAAKAPLVSWDHQGGSAAATGGTFYTGTTFPATYRGAYFYGDYALGFIRSLTVDGTDALIGTPAAFLDASNPVAIEMGPDDALYYAAIFTGELHRISYVAPPPPTGDRLSDINWTTATNGYGPVERDMSNGEAAAMDGRPITLNGVVYAKGLGVHAPSDITYGLGGRCTRLTASVGVDDESGERGSVTFEVWADGVRIYSSPALTATSATAAVDVDVTNKDALRLIVSDGGDGNTSDHASWGDPRLTCASAPPTSEDFISDRAWMSSTNGYGPVEQDMSNGEAAAGDGHPITLNGVVYQKGLGTHAPANVAYSLGGMCTRFIADVGIDDESGAGGSVIFEVWADGVRLLSSPLLTGVSATATIDLDLSNKSSLQLVVLDGGDGNGSDHASWGNARLICDSSIVAPPDGQLSNRTWISATNGYGPVEQDMSNGEAAPGDGHPITLNGVVYQKGLGVHAPSDIEYQLGAACTRFTTSIGIDDESGAGGSVVFEVWANGSRVYNSPTLTGSSPTATIDLDVTSVDALRLVVLDGGDGNASDHASWGNPLLVCGESTVPLTDPNLSDLEWVSATNGYGPVEKDRSNGEAAAGDGQPISIGGLVYSKGLGVHAPSDIEYTLGGNCSSFTADIGVDDESGAGGSVIFEVWADGTRLFNSPVLSGDSPIATFTLDVTGKHSLKLAVLDGGDGNNSDHASWGNPRLFCAAEFSSTDLPVVTIDSPAPTTRYKVGNTISFSGSATDSSGTPIAADHLAWQVLLHHCPGGQCHLHSLLAQSGVSSGSFQAPDEADDNKIEIRLIATDSRGLASTSTILLEPLTVSVTITANKPGVEVSYSGVTGATPLVRSAIVGSRRTVFASSPQGGATFQSWSDGGEQEHNIQIGPTDMTIQAEFR